MGTLFGACRNYISTISEPSPSPKSVAGVTLRHPNISLCPCFKNKIHIILTQVERHADETPSIGFAGSTQLDPTKLDVLARHAESGPSRIVSAEFSLSSNLM
jgi:hypothetical protein